MLDADHYCDYLMLDKYDDIVLLVELTSVIKKGALPPPCNVTLIGVCAPRHCSRALAVLLTIPVAYPGANVGTDGIFCRWGVFCTLFEVL